MLDIKMPEPPKNIFEPKEPIDKGSPIMETHIPNIGQAPSHEFSSAPYSMARQSKIF
jgi:hypothetical protein